MLENEKELLTYMIAAPAAEIDRIRPASLSEAAKLIGLANPAEYIPGVHDLRVIVKLRRCWAQAMIAGAMGM
jgi:hypothetical protein